MLFLRHDTEIIPVGMFTDDAVWRIPVPNFYDVRLPNKTFVHFEYYLIKLRHLDYRQFLQSQNPLVYALMAKMNYNRKERVRLKADFLRLILGSGVDTARQSLLVEFVETYMPLKHQEQVEYQGIVVTEREYQEVEKMITVYEQAGIKKGKKEGRKEGKKEGIEEGKQNTLIMLLEKKFGKLKAAEKRRIRQIDSLDKLNKLLLSVLDAGSLDDLAF